jgi:hypothetical protein
VVYFDIGKQKVIWILKCRKQDEEAVGNALTTQSLALPSLRKRASNAIINGAF